MTPLNLCIFWQVKTADEAGLPQVPPEQRDSYERYDNYNKIGVSVYFMLRLA
jgi:hypothetical protein